MSDGMEKLNPRITEIQIGIRDMRKIKIYPLSIYDQQQFVDKLQKALEEFFMGGAQKGDMEFAVFLVDLIKRNIEVVLEMVSDMKTPEIRKAMREMDNFQLSEIARTIYEKNFEGASKNLGGLRGVIAKLWTPQRPSQQLQKSMAFQLKQSSDGASGTEASPGTNLS